METARSLNLPVDPIPYIFFPLPPRNERRKGRGSMDGACVTRARGGRRREARSRFQGRKLRRAAGRTRRICARRCAIAPAVARNAGERERKRSAMPTTGIHPPTAICTCQTRREEHARARSVADRLDTIALFLLRPRLWSPLESIIAETGCAAACPLKYVKVVPPGRSAGNSQSAVERETRR